MKHMISMIFEIEASIVDVASKVNGIVNHAREECGMNLISIKSQCGEDMPMLRSTEMSDDEKNKLFKMMGD